MKHDKLMTPIPDTSEEAMVSRELWRPMKRMRPWSKHTIWPVMRRALSLAIKSLAVWLVLACSVQAGAITPAPDPSALSPRNALIRAVQQRARHDVKMGKPPEGVNGLQVLFGKEAGAVSLS